MRRHIKRIAVLAAAMLLMSALCACGKKKEPAGTVTPEPEKSGDIVILFTSDVHCGIDQGFGYVGLARIRDNLISEGNEVILVDNGDNIQGEPIGTMTRGKALIELMNKMGYSVAIPGNHEFDYGMDQFLELVSEAQFRYISCNFNHDGNLVFEPYVIRELAGKKVAFVGVTTPKTLTTSTPSYFMDENGNYVFGFLQDATGEGVYNAVQTAIDNAREEGAEYVIVMGHLGNEKECEPWTYADVISHTSGADAFLDGHSHDTDIVSVTNKAGEQVLRIACGTKLEGIGWIKIADSGELTGGCYMWDNDISPAELFGIENEMTEAVKDAYKGLDEALQQVVGYAGADLTVNDPAEVDSNDKPVRMVRRSDTNLGDFCADAYRDQSGADIAFVNGGGIRANVGEGAVTLQEILSVHPYGNSLCVIEVSGQTILDALEWGARMVPDECGGFLQVSGLTYEIHSYIDSPCIADENDRFVGIEGERRVKNVLVNGQPIDPAKTYTLAGHNYMLFEQGDGFTMFGGAVILQDCVKLDSQVLIDYIFYTLGGEIGEAYLDPYGDGRIQIIEH